MSLVDSQLLALREIEQLWPEANAVVIGATALGFYYDMGWRHTADVDFVVALTVDALPSLAGRPGWSRHPKRGASQPLLGRVCASKRIEDAELALLANNWRCPHSAWLSNVEGTRPNPRPSFATR